MNPVRIVPLGLPSSMPYMLSRGMAGTVGQNSDRFVIGSDTWINVRWFQYDSLMHGYRNWLAQLPADQARRIAHGNAERLFGGKVE